MNPKLTQREQEVLDCLMDGLDYKETAKKLCIANTTLYSHRNNIFQKKDVNSLQQLLVKEYKKKLDKANIQKLFDEIRKQIYQQMAADIQKKLEEVKNE